MATTIEVQTDRDLPWVMNFASTKYSHKLLFRETGVGVDAKDLKWDIWMPPPKTINGTDAHSYSKEVADSGLDPSWEGLQEFLRGAGGVWTGLQDLLQFSSTAGQIKMDETSAKFGGSQLRTHTYDWELVPTSKEEAESIEKAAKAFHVGGYPRLSGVQSSSRMIHPDLWIINSAQMSGMGKFGEQWRWDMQPLPAVITNVNIVNHGSAGGSYALGSKKENYPVKTNLSVTFAELDPAIQDGNHIISRSMARSFIKAGVDEHKRNEANG